MTAVLTKTGSPSERFTSRNPDDFPIPNRSQEDWRFTPLPRIREFYGLERLWTVGDDGFEAAND